MKNTEFIIHLRYGKNGREQSFRRNERGWYMTSGAGHLYDCTAEQVLNHLLPALLPEKPVTVKVETGNKSLSPGEGPQEVA